MTICSKNLEGAMAPLAPPGYAYVTSYVCFCSPTMLTAKIITEIVENLCYELCLLPVMFMLPDVCLCSPTMLTAKIITEITENHSEFSGCPNSCNKFISSQSC